MSAWRRFRNWLNPRAGAVDLADLRPVVARASQQAAVLADLSAEALAERLTTQPTGWVDDNDALAEFLATVRELADRHVSLRPYDVQLQAAAAMLRGTSVELATGEGKTLVGALVAIGLVRSGRRVHVLSTNDYLAERDATWMGPLLEAARTSVAFVTAGSTNDERRAAYAADIVYVAVTELGFDILRERLCAEPEELVGVEPDAAVLDEADAVLLDEARVPLVLAGEASTDQSAEPGVEMAQLVADLEEGADFEVDSDRRTLHLTDQGITRVEGWFPAADVYGEDHEILARVHVALHARSLLLRDVDYVVDGDRARLVSQSRGRIEALQRWPEGLQEAVEAKEGLTSTGRVEILDQLLVRDLLGEYTTSVGMSGTLVSAAEELHELYELKVTALPPNRPLVRVDEPDRLYATGEARDAAAVELITDLHAAGQPILVATQSVAECERFGGLLLTAGLDAVVLHAGNDAAEAEIIAAAGSPGRITVSTQMAGRGTDIQLSAGMAERGGLFILGLGRFPNRRLDDQLRGRSGRQGDPGRTVFLTSLDDSLVSEQTPEHAQPTRLGPDGQVTEARVASVSDQAQRTSEGQEQQLRALARKYAKLIALQRSRVLDLRQTCLLNDDLAVTELRSRVAALPNLADRLDTLTDLVGSAAVAQAARRALIGSLDRRWSDHLAHAAGIREGIHLQALAKQEPVQEFNRLIHEAFTGLIDSACADAADLLARAEVVGDSLDLDSAGLYRPGATWTYLVSDDHFGSDWERIGRFLRRQFDGR